VTLKALKTFNKFLHVRLKSDSNKCKSATGSYNTLLWTREYFEWGFVFRPLRMHPLTIIAQTHAVVRKDRQITGHVFTEVQSSESTPCYDVWGDTCVCCGHASWDDDVRTEAYVLFYVRSSEKIYSPLKLYLTTRYEAESILHAMRRQRGGPVFELSIYRTPWDRNPLETIISQLVKKFPTFYGNWWSIAGVRYLSLFWATRNQTASWHTILPGLLLI
jgi:hypothetical protein